MLDAAQDSRNSGETDLAGDDLKAKLEMLIRSPDRVHEYEARARAHIERHYSWDKVAQQTEELYRDMLAR